MFGRFAVAIMALITLLAIGFAWHERNLAVASVQALTAAPLAARECPRSGLADFGKVVSTALAAKRVHVAPSAGPRETGGTLDDLPAEDQTKMFDATDALRDGATTDLADIAAKLHLRADQERALRERIEQMNQRIASSLDRLLALTTQTAPVAPRAVIDALADGLNAIRETDDGFLATLDDSQRQQLQQDRFDMTSQVDPTMLLTRVMGFASAWPSSDDDDTDTKAPDHDPKERRVSPRRSVTLATSLSRR